MGFGDHARIFNGGGEVRVDSDGNAVVTGTLTIDAGTLILGGDVNLYRSQANELKTDDNFMVIGTSGAMTNGGDPQSFFIGGGGGFVTTGVNNCAVGMNALLGNTTGSSNSAVGLNALLVNTTGSSNSAVGMNVLRDNTTGSNNTAVGMQALLDNTTGNSNTAVGMQALRGNADGDNNTGVGVNAGRFIADGVTPNQAGSSSLFLGRDTKANADGETNQVVIGFGTIGNGANTVTLGNTSITDTYLRGDVTIEAAGGSGGLTLPGDLTVDSGATGLGSVFGGATGGAQGAGTLNAVGVYDDGSILSDYVLDLHYDGETEHDVPEWWAGPYELSTVAQTMATERRLPWMPSRDEWVASKHSLGSLMSRLWAGQEQLAIHMQTIAEGVGR